MDVNLQKINDIISNNINALIENDGSDEAAFVRVQRLTEVKRYMENQKITRWDMGKVVSNLGLVIMTIIPVVLQWVLGLLEF